MLPQVRKKIKVELEFIMGDTSVTLGQPSFMKTRCQNKVITNYIMSFHPKKECQMRWWNVLRSSLYPSIGYIRGTCDLWSIRGGRSDLENTSILVAYSLCYHLSTLSKEYTISKCSNTVRLLGLYEPFSSALWASPSKIYPNWDTMIIYHEFSAFQTMLMWRQPHFFFTSVLCHIRNVWILTRGKYGIQKLLFCVYDYSTFVSLYLCCQWPHFTPH